MTQQCGAERDRRLCFVLVPFGVKGDGPGGFVDFDAVYEQLIAPAVEDARLKPARVGWDVTGSLEKPMLEWLTLAEYAVADVTRPDPKVVYEIGVRDAVRPNCTVLVGADLEHVPRGFAADRVYSYGVDGSGRPVDATGQRIGLRNELREALSATNRPAVGLLIEPPAARIDRLKTDLFRCDASYSMGMKRWLAKARTEGAAAVRDLESDLGPLEQVEVGVLVDLLLSYRATRAWSEMISLVERMPAPLARTVLVQEQFGFALNRAGRSDEAERVLRAVIADHGPSSETYGLLGRVYKDRWEAVRDGDTLAARDYLDQAVDAYRRGFEADWRDAYPGVNAVTLMEIRDPGGADQLELAPVVRYANRRRIDGGATDYWDHAARVELAVVVRDRGEALAGVGIALAVMRESWEPESTAYNLSLIRRARAEHGEVLAWADELECDLVRAAESVS